MRNHPEKFILLLRLLLQLIPRNAERLLRGFEHVNVGACAEPIHDLAAVVVIRQGAAEKPSIDSVRCSFQSELNFVRRARAESLGPGVVGPLHVIWMK